MKTKENRRDTDGDENGHRDITIDELYCEIGEFGLWQWVGIALLWLPSLASGMMVLTFSYSGELGQLAKSNQLMSLKSNFIVSQLQLQLRRNGVRTKWSDIAKKENWDRCRQRTKR